MQLDNFYDIGKQFYYEIYTYGINLPSQMKQSLIYKKESDAIFYNHVTINFENRLKFDWIFLILEVNLEKSITMSSN